MTLAEYRSCLAIARRHARNAAEAEDLLHEALIAGLKAGRQDFTAPADRAWLSGVMRNIALETARGIARRRRREMRWAEEQPANAAPAEAQEPAHPAILARLSEGTRRVAVLALYGLNADEIQYVLQLKPPAFRQRLASLRRTLGELPEPLSREALALAYSQPQRAGPVRLDFGLIRRALLHHLKGGGGIGTHDPDGHLLTIRTR